MKKNKGVFLIELLIAVALVIFLVIAFFNSSSTINMGYEMLEKNSTAIFLMESVSNWVKVKLEQGYTLDSLPTDEIDRLIGSEKYKVMFKEMSETLVSAAIVMKRGNRERVYNFEVKLNE